MVVFILHRLLSLVVSCFFASLFVFCFLNSIPGDLASLVLGVNADPETLLALREKLGTDRPAPYRYLLWIWGVLCGDLGYSYSYHAPVAELVLERLQVTVPLASLAFLTCLLLAIPLGILCVLWRGHRVDVGLTTLGQIGLAVPDFWLGILLIWGFSIVLGWFPSGGFSGWDSGILSGLQSLFLPMIALALPQAAVLMRVVRSTLCEVTTQEYTRAARAKGASPIVALYWHGTRNALVPILNILGLQFSFLLAGTIIIENVFSLGGLGKLIVQAVGQRDLILVQGIVLVLIFSVLVVNSLIDILCMWVDPRLRGRS